MSCPHAAAEATEAAAPEATEAATAAPRRIAGRIEKSAARRPPEPLLLGSVPASGTRDIGTRFDSTANGTGTLRQFVSKATPPKLPGGLLLSPGLSCLFVPRTVERLSHPVRANATGPSKPLEGQLPADTATVAGRIL
jgi:hypothetical protein